MNMKMITVMVAIGLVGCSDDFLGDNEVSSSRPSLQSKPILFPPSGLDPETAVASLRDRIWSNTSLMRSLAECPADVYQQAEVNTVNKESCEENLDACYNACREGEAEACFWTANFQQVEFELSDDTTFPLYMRSCELGMSIGCVNAAATARNGDWAEDIELVAQGDNCQQRSYEVNCTQEDAEGWGCTMLNWHYPDSDVLAAARGQ